MFWLQFTLVSLQSEGLKGSSSQASCYLYHTESEGSMPRYKQPLPVSVDCRQVQGHTLAMSALSCSHIGFSNFVYILRTSKALGMKAVER